MSASYFSTGRGGFRLGSLFGCGCFGGDERKPISNKEDSRGGCCGRCMQKISDCASACKYSVAKVCRNAKAIFNNEEFQAGASLGLILGVLVVCVLIVGLAYTGWPLLAIVAAVAITTLLTMGICAIYRYVTKKDEMEMTVLKNNVADVKWQTELLDESANNDSELKNTINEIFPIYQKPTKEKEEFCGELIDSISKYGFDFSDISLGDRQVSRKFLNPEIKREDIGYGRDKSKLLAARQLIQNISPLGELAGRIPSAMKNRREMQKLKKDMMAIPLFAQWVAKLKELYTKFDSREAILFAAPFLMSSEDKRTCNVTNEMLVELLTELIHDPADSLKKS